MRRPRTVRAGGAAAQMMASAPGRHAAPPRGAAARLRDAPPLTALRAHGAPGMAQGPRRPGRNAEVNAAALALSARASTPARPPAAPQVPAARAPGGRAPAAPRTHPRPPPGCGWLRGARRDAAHGRGARAMAGYAAIGGAKPVAGSSSALLEDGGLRGPRKVDTPPAAHPPAQRFGLEAFLEDTQDITGGTLPVSVVIALCIGVVCGVVAWLYYTVLEFLLEVVWKDLPHRFFVADALLPESMYWIWIPIVGMTFAAGVGLSIQMLGEPGDLAYTVGCVHKKGYIAMSHVLPMVFASQFSILAGGSLGPEAPLVAICASFGGWMSLHVFGQKYKNVVRKHTLMGMACALAAFFGVPLGGSLFALEINSRFGYEYFEHALEAILSGTVCLVVFRGLAGLPIGPIWSISDDSLGPSTPFIVASGAFIGLLGATLAFLFAQFHARNMKAFTNAGLMDSPLPRALVGGLGICTIGVLIPHSMFARHVKACLGIDSGAHIIIPYATLTRHRTLTFSPLCSASSPYPARSAFLG